MIFPKLFKLHCWPGVTCAWFLVTFIITYIVSTQGGHVHPFFPFISDTGSVPPESCIFGQMMNIGALLMAIVVYVRYRQIEFAINSKSIDLHKWWNTASLFFGIVSCFGISVVANFQETSLLLVHILGAVMIFGSGSIYLFIQSRITFAFRHVCKNYPDYWVGKKIFYLRIILTLIVSTLYCVVLICGLIALLKFTGTTVIWWTEAHGGFKERLAATFSEWIMVVAFFVYILSFTKEFKSLGYKEVYFNNKCASDSKCSSEVAGV